MIKRFELSFLRDIKLNFALKIKLIKSNASFIR